MTTCRTLGDVRAFILKQPEHIQERGSWQHATELMILAAERGGNIKRQPLRLKTLCFWKRGTCGNGTNGARPAPKRPRSPFSLDALIPSWFFAPLRRGFSLKAAQFCCSTRPTLPR